MTTWLLPILTALLGYGGHWLQAGLTRRHKRKDVDEERIEALLTKLAEIRDLDENSNHEGMDLAAKLGTDAGLLRNKKLRQRVNEALVIIRTFSMRTDQDVRLRSIRETWAQDAILCCQAVLRGDRLPRYDSQAERQLFSFQETVGPTGDSRALLARMREANPDFARRERAFWRWQAKQHPWWRRTPRMWVRLLRSE
ncbi:hypothetical protein [Streptomyces sp. NPDC086776]|uniref:hypothetical protein n=1 Tax=Streptomyces sp. NPDC086776 TaxID=3365756 RepID=UPI0037F74F9F